jgi:hypothetical protein
MESKVAKNTSNCRSLSISLLGNSVAIKPVLQQQILASIALSGRELVTNDLPNKTEIALETIPVHRLSDDTVVVYRSAIALKLAPLWQLPAVEIAHQLADSIAIVTQETANAGTGNRIMGERESGRVGDCRISQLCPQDDQQTFTPSPPRQVGLDFSVEVLSPGWIQFWLSDRGLATWLQQLIQIPALLSDLEDDLSIGFQWQGEVGERETEIKNRYSPELEITHQGQLTERSKIIHPLFSVQYGHARCCSLLRLAHRQGLIELSDLDFNTLGWQFVEPNPIPWLYGDSGMESESLRLRLGQPAERGLIAQVLDGIDRISDPAPASAIKIATSLSTAFETFYSACRIWGEVKTETPQLAQARLGLVGVTQKFLRSLLQHQLGVTAPLEL